MLGAFFAPLGLPELVVGGGLGVPYVNGERRPTPGRVGRRPPRPPAPRPASTRRRGSRPSRGAPSWPTAGLTLYTVGTVKHLPGIRTYVSVDGGMSDNPRPVLYGSGYEAFLPRAAGAPRPRPVRVVGKHCESGDLVVPDAFVPDGPRGRRRPGHSGHRRLRLRHGVQLQQGAPARRRLRVRRQRPRGGPARDLRGPDCASTPERHARPAANGPVRPRAACSVVGVTRRHRQRDPAGRAPRSDGAGRACSAAATSAARWPRSCSPAPDDDRRPHGHPPGAGRHRRGRPGPAPARRHRRPTLIGTDAAALVGARRRRRRGRAHRRPAPGPRAGRGGPASAASRW